MGEMLDPRSGRSGEVRYYRLEGSLMQLGIVGLNEVTDDLDRIGRPVFDAGFTNGQIGGSESGERIQGEIVVLDEPLGDYETERLHSRGARVTEISASKSFLHSDYLNIKH